MSEIKNEKPKRTNSKNPLPDNVLVSSEDFCKITESEETIPLSSGTPRKLIRNSFFSSSSEGKKARHPKRNENKACCFSFLKK